MTTYFVSKTTPAELLLRTNDDIGVGPAGCFEFKDLYNRSEIHPLIAAILRTSLVEMVHVFEDHSARLSLYNHHLESLKGGVDQAIGIVDIAVMHFYEQRRAERPAHAAA